MIRNTILVVLSAAFGVPALAGVSAEEAAQLKTTLTPVGAERAGNKDGSIPAWEGGFTGPAPTGRRGDPFAEDKPLFSITGANMAQYADKLSEGSKTLLKKYPDYRIDVYKTRRTFAAPTYIYERTAKNAVSTSLADGSAAKVPANFNGGYPFPIPKTGEEVMFNHVLRWNGANLRVDTPLYTVSAQGRLVLAARNDVDISYPLNLPAAATRTDGVFFYARGVTTAPPVQKGAGLLSVGNIDPEKNQFYAYLTGQRRVKLVPNACCDTPAPNTSGVINFDELNVFDGTLKAFDWKIVGKKEMYIPYNSNRVLVPAKDSDVLGGKFLKPELVRWELHRVWVLEANVKAGRRHINPRNTYYLDEDSWSAVLGDRYDAQGQLVKVQWSVPIVLPEVPVIMSQISGAYDLLSGQWFAVNVLNEAKSQFEVVKDYPQGHFTPDTFAGEGVR